MTLTISKGRRAVPVRGCFYGPEGIGKSTLASHLPSPLFLDVEDGTAQLDVARVACPTWDALVAAVKQLATNPHGAQTIVIDSADWAEKALIEHMLTQSGKSSIEDYGFGKGYTILAEHWMRFLGLCDALVAAGLHVVFTGHSAVKRMSPPDQTDGYDRFELKLTKQVAPLLKEWSDLLLFANFKINVVEGTDGKIKAQGGRERVMYATHSAAWDAKNRFGLPDEMPMEYDQIEHLFGGGGVRREARPIAESAAPSKLATVEQVFELTKLAKTEIGGGIIERALAKANAVDVSELTEDQAAKTLAFIAEKIAAVTAPAAEPAVEVAPADEPPCMPVDLAKWLGANEETVNGYLERVKWIGKGQTFRDLPVDKVAKIDDRREQFARAAGISKEAA